MQRVKPESSGRNSTYGRLIAGRVLMLFATGLMLSAGADSPDDNERVGGTAMLLTVADAIGPAQTDYIKRGLRLAHERGHELVILKIDTPGGLDTAMRDINRAIIASPVPVVSYVAPSGARAASAGTYILYASHFAAMAPGTNLGAATPVQIGGIPSLPPRSPPKPDKDADDEEFEADDTEDEKDTVPRTADAMTKKMVNDAVAYIRGLAQMRGRNEEWAETAVREGASLPAEDALAANVVDVIAVNERALLVQLDGRVVEVHGVDITLETEHMLIEVVAPDWRTELLSVIASPNVAYILMLLGVYGLFFELANPGAIFPGVVGAICLLLAMFALQMMPVNYAGLALILLGIAFMIGELFVPSFGALGIGGVVAFAIGSVILFDTDTQQFRVSISIVVAVTTLTAAFFLLAIRALFNARKGPVVSGPEELVGTIGNVLHDFASTGQIRVRGEIWKAHAVQPMQSGDRVKVTAIDGLTLYIEPAEEEGS